MMCGFRWRFRGETKEHPCRLIEGHREHHRDGLAWVAVGAERTVESWWSHE